MNMFRLQLRFLVPLVLTLGAVAGPALPLMDRLTLGRFEHDLDLRGAPVTNSLADSIAEAVADPKRGRLQALFDSTAQDERLMAVGLCGPDGRVLRRTARFPAALSCAQARQAVERADSVLHLEGRSVHVGMYPVNGASGRVGDLLLLRDMSSIERRTQDTRRYLIIVIAALGAAIAIVTVVVAQLSWRGWVSGVRALLRGEGLLRTQLRGDEIIVVSNREPYIHESTPAGIIVKRPASGLVTAIEPVLRACSGTWIAHGSGSADAQVVDARDRVLAPPGRGEYTLRRVWLSEQEAGRAVPAPGDRAIGACARSDACRRRRSPRLHQGNPGADARRRAPARKAPGVDRAFRTRADRRALAQFARGIPSIPGPHRPGDRADQPALRPCELSADSFAGRAPRSRCGHRVVPRRRRGPGDQPA